MKKRSQVKIPRKRIFWAPNGSRTHDLQNTGWTLYFDLRTLFHYLHFIQVTDSFIIEILLNIPVRKPSCLLFLVCVCVCGDISSC